MNNETYLNEMKSIQVSLLKFIEKDENTEINLDSLLNDIKSRNGQHDLRSLLHLILKISNNHCRNHSFFNKIEQILEIFKLEIQKNFSNDEIFNIFKSNKRILFFLIEEKIITINEYIAKKMITDKFRKLKYPQFFTPEMIPFINKKWSSKLKYIEEFNKELPREFYEERKIGENDNLICKLIRKDSVSDFIEFVNKNNIKLNSTIKTSIYETNNFLLKQDEEVSLIEYASFYGSIQIVNYLKGNGVELKPILWNFAIHSNKLEMIQLLEENHVLPNDNTIYNESIKCHHNDITNYILKKYKNDEVKPYDVFIQSLKYYNFCFIQKEFMNENSFYNLCKYGYNLPLCNILQSEDVNMNTNTIVNKIY